MIDPNVPLIKGHKCLSLSLASDWNIPSEYLPHISYFLKVWHKDYIRDKIHTIRDLEYVKFEGVFYKICLYKIGVKEFQENDRLKLSFRKFSEADTGFVLLTTYIDNTNAHRVAVRGTRNF